MWVSPCRSDPAKGGRRHHCSWWHAALVESYRLARVAQDQRAEAYSSGYATELAAFYRDLEPPVTFRAWLQAWAPAATEPAT